MNELEKKMATLLRRSKAEAGVVAVKAEFEAEGTRIDELLRLVDIAHKADLPIAIKIGGCEAFLDLMEAKLFGASYIIAPMIESPYALSKYAAATHVVFDDAERADASFLFNIETKTGMACAQELVDTAVQTSLQGVVFGRTDYCGSLGRSGNAINDPDIVADVIAVAEMCKPTGLDLVVGGGVSIDSLGAMRRIRDVHLTRFETRKVIFGAEALDTAGIEDGLLNAVHFELLWLMNKRDYYGRITNEDARRIQTLEDRWHVLARDV